MDDNTYRTRVNAINKVIVGLHRVGIAFGPMQPLTVKGRRTGRMLTFPIAVNKLHTGRYIFQAFPKASWVANARAADTVTLTRGRRAATARLTEVPVDQRGPLLRELVADSPASVGKRFVTTGLAEDATPDGVAAAAHRIAVFRVDPA
ncbi:nitroreductase family deazaflavin-dependent oxidoreductase [Amycolatopsis pithecellobii]|uniref:Nitroreductase family deazaflavin-dependent oxidoreductase n=1 Tax=Amycolatopsis pithecellobii TaxID=664692 RepID=A0A6N7Z069_9PSEU|nr:nitroreductase family deazaflavin-dependent oxidoreductase [Amycolatopsis pithecellobii]MTD53141.1 nitroreductase family deazaflavin-dependent oxidoreductase [Amycolatopsis pithecellobii]